MTKFILRLTKKLDSSITSVKNIIKHYIGIYSIKLQRSRTLDVRMKATRFQKSLEFLKRFSPACLLDVIFTGEKSFTIEQCRNSQKDRILLSLVETLNAPDRYDYRKGCSASVMVWARVRLTGKNLGQGIKINIQNYLNYILMEEQLS